MVRVQGLGGLSNSRGAKHKLSLGGLVKQNVLHQLWCPFAEAPPAGLCPSDGGLWLFLLAQAKLCMQVLLVPPGISSGGEMGSPAWKCRPHEGPTVSAVSPLSRFGG